MQLKETSQKVSLTLDLEFGSNKFKMNKILIISFLLFSIGLSKSIQKKVNKEIKSTFETEAFTLSEVMIDPELANSLASDFNNNNLFKIESENRLLGYAYISKAFGKLDYFDYLVLLDKDLIVLKSKILVYREDYGGEIGSKRWLKQLIGKTKGDTLIYGKNIMAISGATISVQAMTNAMNDLFYSLKILHSKKIL